MTWWETALGVLAGVLLLYAVLLFLLWRYARAHPETVTMRDALRLLPDLLRLIRRLVADPTVPRGVRIRLVLLLVYLALPIDLVPDFIPVIGYADDAIIVALVLKSTIRHAGAEPLRRHWPGTPEGLRLIETLAGISNNSPPQTRRSSRPSRKYALCEDRVNPFTLNHWLHAGGNVWILKLRR